MTVRVNSDGSVVVDTGDIHARGKEDPAADFAVPYPA
jgi:hypothetical protein